MALPTADILENARPARAWFEALRNRICSAFEALFFHAAGREVAVNAV